MPIDILREAWSRNYFNHLTEVFLVCLVIFGVYEVYFASLVLTRLRLLRKLTDNDALRRNVTELQLKSSNAQQMLLALFYFFGLTLFVQLGQAYFTPESKNPVGLMVLENLWVYFSFAAVVFLVFLVYHSVQWFVYLRLCKVMRSF